jgi:hypothetical protein
MARKKLNVRVADKVRSTPKRTNTKAMSGVASTVPRRTHPGRNLGKYLHKSKLPAGGKIGTAGVKMKPRKSNKVKKGY